MTFAELKRTLEDRIETLKDCYSEEACGRYQEAKVVLALFDRVDEVRARPSSERREYPWGKQPRGNWPETTFGAPDDDSDRYDPARC